ncbi:MAG: Succinyl-CoA ligase (ADP-forming) subunit alpha [Candidatus Aminicenantes bacterium ADurb.Bin147]|jgi:succinyl-CoA synthetase (ADP-forming) alpha subunit (EC 6.2.1.5)|nr:succinate--CoA ligase subunit alpha [Acidobacteriota bacterium]OQB57851.1 MAG: Succinyl-CoA ligase (ADP-forming) subunit alpha [Candidatus Aminicenantes bacterium ADurb.Bin147]HPN15610.1 succinate--CoA ligase subunit alpha [Candidatus Aminicenantes bacterium]
MSILVGRDSRVIVQGFTGKEGSFHAQRMIEYGTRLVGGVSPGKGGRRHLGRPVFDTVRQARAASGADVSVLFVPPFAAADAIMEAAEAGISLIVAVTEGIPVLDVLRVRAFLRRTSSLLIGPNTPGVITPGRAKVGIMPGSIHRPGRIGILSRSGTLTYEAVRQISDVGLGQSTAVGIGGDAVTGLSFVDGLKLFRADPETDAVVLIGEIGGTAEEDAARLIRDQYPKPVFAYIAGLTSPPERRMGHAGAIIEGRAGRAGDKARALSEAGAIVIPLPSEIGATVAARL